MFNEDNIFIKTSNVASNVERLNTRLRILTEGVDFKNKRVLDLGAHNGRWAWVALQMGADYVKGVDFNPEYIKQAVGNFKNFPDLKAEFVCGDMLDFLNKSHPGDYDVILCLGIMYHSLNQYEILRQCCRLKPSLMIVDTTVVNAPAVLNTINSIGHLSSFRGSGYTWSITRKQPLTGNWEMIPTKHLMEVWLDQAGFEFKRLDNFGNNPTDNDYKKGIRVGYHCKVKNEASIN